MCYILLYVFFVLICIIVYLSWKAPEIKLYQTLNKFQQRPVEIYNLLISVVIHRMKGIIWNYCLREESEKGFCSWWSNDDVSSFKLMDHHIFVRANNSVGKTDSGVNTISVKKHGNELLPVYTYIL